MSRGEDGEEYHDVPEGGLAAEYTLEGVKLELVQHLHNGGDAAGVGQDTYGIEAPE